MKFRLGGYMGLLRRSIHETKTSGNEGTPEVIKASSTKAYKKIGFVSAVIGAFLILPLAVQALSGSVGSDKNKDQQNESNKSEGGSVQSTTTEHSDSEHSGAPVDGQQSAGASSSTNSSSVDVSVNGQSIPVPQNGSVKKTITDNNGNTTIDISVQNHQSTSGSSHVHSSTDIDYDSDSGASDMDTSLRGGLRSPRVP